VDLLAATPPETGSTRASGAVSATSAAGDATPRAPVSTADTRAITPPRLGNLLGADAPGSTGGTATSDGTGSDPPGSLDETLPTPTAPASGLPNVDDVTDPVKKQDVTDPVKKDLGSVTDPLTP
jgi:hypothetical protein